jgi:hypothetical protein
VAPVAAGADVLFSAGITAVVLFSAGATTAAGVSVALSADAGVSVGVTSFVAGAAGVVLFAAAGALFEEHPAAKTIAAIIRSIAITFNILLIILTSKILFLFIPIHIIF